MELHLRLSPHLELRLLEEFHAHALFDVIQSNRLYLREWLPWIDTLHTAGDARTLIHQGLRHVEESAGLNAGVWVDHSLVGMITLHSIHLVHRHGALGYWLAQDQQGRGTITTAARGMIDHAIDALNLHRIEIRAATENRRSIAVAERLGFTREGTLRQAEWVHTRFVDHALFSLLSDEWETEL